MSKQKSFEKEKLDAEYSKLMQSIEDNNLTSFDLLTSIREHGEEVLYARQPSIVSQLITTQQANRLLFILRSDLISIAKIIELFPVNDATGLSLIDYLSTHFMAGGVASDQGLQISVYNKLFELLLDLHESGTGPKNTLVNDNFMHYFIYLLSIDQIPNLTLADTPFKVAGNFSSYQGRYAALMKMVQNLQITKADVEWYVHYHLFAVALGDGITLKLENNGKLFNLCSTGIFSAADGGLQEEYLSNILRNQQDKFAQIIAMFEYNSQDLWFRRHLVEKHMFSICLILKPNAQKLIICNRGESWHPMLDGVLAYDFLDNIAPTPALCEKIMQALEQANMSTKDTVKVLQKYFKTPPSKRFYELTPQVYANCSWANSKSMIYPVLYYIGDENAYKHYKELSNFIRERLFNDLLDKYKTFASPLDETFLSLLMRFSRKSHQFSGQAKQEQMLHFNGILRKAVKHKSKVHYNKYKSVFDRKTATNSNFFQRIYQKVIQATSYLSSFFYTNSTKASLIYQKSGLQVEPDELFADFSVFLQNKITYEIRQLKDLTLADKGAKLELEVARTRVASAYNDLEKFYETKESKESLDFIKNYIHNFIPSDSSRNKSGKKILFQKAKAPQIPPSIIEHFRVNDYPDNMP